MPRKFLALVLVAAFGMAIGGMACVETQATLDRSDETDGST
jgi:hypothetical protein